MKPLISMLAVMLITACTKNNQIQTAEVRQNLSMVGILDNLVIRIDTLTGKISTVQNNTKWADMELGESDTGHFSFFIARNDKGNFSTTIKDISQNGFITYQCGYANILYWPNSLSLLSYTNPKSVYFHLFAHDSTNINHTFHEAYFYLATRAAPSADIVTNITIGPVREDSVPITSSMLSYLLSSAHFNVKRFSFK